MKFHKLAFVLLLIGGLNWLLQGVFNRDLFVLLGMDMSDWLPRVVYVLVGLSAVLELLGHRKLCKLCDKNAMMS